MTIRNSSRTGYLRAISRVLLCVFVVGQLSESVGLAQGGGIFAMWTQAENVKAKSRDIVARNEARKTRKSVKVAKAHKQQYNTGVQKTDNSTKTPVVTAPPKPPSAPLNYQTFALKVITLARQPVANLPVPLEVSIPLKQGSRVTGTKVLGTRTVSTDQDGLARYTKIGPLPAQLKIGLRDPDAEYSIYDEGKVAIALVRGSNLQIAEDQRPRLDISTLTASLYPMMAAATRAKARAKAVAAPAKEIVFNASQPTEIVVQRNIADLVVKSPEGAQVDLVGVSGYSDSWSSSRDTNASDGVTTTRFRIHRSLLEEGAVAVMVTKSGGAGDYEAVQRGYTPDYYNETTIEVKPEDLQLVNIKDVSIAKHLSVLDQKEQADAAYGKTKDSMDPKDGSKWWRYEDDGVWALARKWPGAKAPEVVERIRLVKPDGGSVAGIKVGDSKEKLLDTLGAAKKPERIRLQLSSGSKNKLQDTDTLAYNYFDRGLTFYVGQGGGTAALDFAQIPTTGIPGEFLMEALAQVRTATTDQSLVP